MSLTLISQAKTFGGWHQQFSHFSTSLNCQMRFAIFLPPQVIPAQNHQKKPAAPVLFWLSGLTCTDENFMQKAGALKTAAELGLAIVAPDTSPRGEGVADDPNAAYDLGLGAGFYLNASQPPWRKHYQMYTYITEELPAIIEQNFPVNNRRGISGHSMGGHGALTVGLKNPQLFQSISALSPICNPINCPWGQKAFSAYLGADKTTWQEYDSVEIIKTLNQLPPILIDQGTADNFLAEQLHTSALISAAREKDLTLDVRMQEGYDHSFYFVSTFIAEHLQFHYRHLSAQ